MSTSNGHFVHRTIDGDRWDLIAWQWYGDARRQTLLLEANRELFLDPLRVPPAILPAGLEIKVPVIDVATADENLLPPWKRKSPDYTS